MTGSDQPDRRAVTVHLTDEGRCLIRDLFLRVIQVKALVQNLARLVTLKPTSKGWRGRDYPLDTWESLEVHKGDATLTITAMPAKHATEEAVNELLMPVNGH